MSCMLPYSLVLLVWMLRLMNFNELLVSWGFWLMRYAHGMSREILTKTSKQRDVYLNKQLRYPVMTGEKVRVYVIFSYV